MENNNIKVIDEIDYGNGEFEFINDNYVKEILKSAHKAISLCELWNWLRIYEPPSGKGFMFNSTPELDKINEQMWKDPINNNHSGGSYAFVMRQMEYIAKNNYNNYKNNYNKL
jgi:hypothetical protein